MWDSNGKMYKCLTTPTAFMQPNNCMKMVFPDNLHVGLDKKICDDPDWPETYVIRLVL